MQRPRPRAKHRSLTNKRNSLPSATARNKLTSNASSTAQNTIQRPSLPKRHRKNQTEQYSAKMVSLIQSESKQQIQDEDENDMLAKISKIGARQNKRKSDFGKDLDEMKQIMLKMKQNEEHKTSTQENNDKKFIDNKNANKYNQNGTGALPASLRLIGVHDTKSLLYHRQYMNELETINNGNHQRAQSLAIGPTTNNSSAATNPSAASHRPQSSSVANFQHLRSFSSIMSPNQRPSAQNGNNINSKSSNKAFQLKKLEKTLSLEQLADEYQSESDDEEEQDDDIKQDG